MIFDLKFHSIKVPERLHGDANPVLCALWRAHKSNMIGLTTIFYDGQRFFLPLV